MKRKNENNAPKTVAIIMLILMVFSIAGFALVGKNIGNTNEDGNPENLPFGEYQQNGQTFWAAIKNSEIFVFESIEGFEERQDLNEMAQRLKTLNYVEIYIDEGYVDSNAPFLIEQKLSTAFGYIPQRIPEEKCSENTIIITYNTSKTGECMIFKTSPGEEERDSNILAYHMVKN